MRENPVRASWFMEVHDHLHGEDLLLLILASTAALVTKHLVERAPLQSPA
jgi:hypothetical protein